MKYEWSFSDTVKGVVNSYDEAVKQLNKHLDFDITDPNGYKTEFALCNEVACGLCCETAYFYPNTTPDEDIQKDDGTATPHIRGVCERHYDFLK